MKVRLGKHENISKLKNPLRNRHFDRHVATEGRSARFRAIVILLVVSFIFLMIYALSLKNNGSQENGSIPRHTLGVKTSVKQFAGRIVYVAFLFEIKKIGISLESENCSQQLSACILIANHSCG